MVSTTPHIRRYPGHLLREFVLESGPIIRPRQKGISGPVPGTEMPVAGACQLRTTTPMKGEITVLLTTIRRVIATLGLAYLVAFATNWLAWHPSETSGLKAAFTADLGANWAVAGWAILALLIMVWGVMDKRRWTTVLGYGALALALMNGVFVTRGITADYDLTLRMVGVLLLGVGLFIMAIWPSGPEFRHVEIHGWVTRSADRRTLAAGQPGRVQRGANRLNAWGLGLERRFRNWREDRQFDREQRRAQRAAAVPPAPDADDYPVFGPPAATSSRPSRPAPPVSAIPVEDHSTVPAAPASGSNPTSS